MRGACGERRERHQPLGLRRALTHRLELRLATRQRVGRLHDEVGGELGRRGDRDPHREQVRREVVQPVVHGVELPQVPVDEQPEASGGEAAEQALLAERPSVSAASVTWATRMTREGIERSAGQVQQAHEQRRVEHQRRQRERPGQGPAAGQADGHDDVHDSSGEDDRRDVAQREVEPGKTHATPTTIASIAAVVQRSRISHGSVASGVAPRYHGAELADMPERRR